MGCPIGRCPLGGFFFLLRLMAKETTLVLFEELAEEAPAQKRTKRRAAAPRRPSVLTSNTDRVPSGVKSLGRAFTPSVGEVFTEDDFDAIPSLRRAGQDEVPDKIVDDSTTAPRGIPSITPSVSSSAMDDEPFLKLDPGFDTPFDYLNPEVSTPDWTVDVPNDDVPNDVPWEIESSNEPAPSDDLAKANILELVAPAATLLAPKTKAKPARTTPKVPRKPRVKKKAFNPLEDEPEDPRSGVKSFDPDERNDRPVRARKPRPTQSLMARALNALARREYARKGLEAKLRQGLTEEDDPDEIERVLDELEKLNYLSDERFAVMRTEQKARTQGDRKLRYELRQQGVKPEAVEAAMENLTESEVVRCYRLWERRFGEKPTDRKERERQIRYLTYRGFSFSSVMSVIRGEVNPDEEIE